MLLSLQSNTADVCLTCVLTLGSSAASAATCSLSHNKCTAVLIIPGQLYVLHMTPFVGLSCESAFDMATCLLQGTGPQLGQLQKEVLRLTNKLAGQQSKTAQAETAATLLQISVDLSQKVSHTLCA